MERYADLKRRSGGWERRGEHVRANTEKNQSRDEEKVRIKKGYDRRYESTRGQEEE